MKKKVTIVDYGLGNIVSAQQSFLKVVKDNGFDTEIIISNDPDQVRKSTHVVLPGQGAFKSCIAGLKSVPGMIDALEESIIKNKLNYQPKISLEAGLREMWEINKNL